MSPELASLVMRHLAGEQFGVRAECARIDCSTSSFYKYRSRVERAGVDGFYPRSRRPRSSPGQISDIVEDLIVLARKGLNDEGWYAGADSIRFQLEAWRDAVAGTDTGDGQVRCGLLEPVLWPPHEPIPARATINRVLARRGQLLAVPKRRPRAANRRFEATNPNGRWQMDGFVVDLLDGTKVCVLHVVDDCSRYDIALVAVRSENSADVWATVQAAAAAYGFPAEFLTDNGTAFSGARRGWMSPLTERLNALGVRHVTSSIAHPQTCGKDERAHQTVRHWLAKRPLFATAADLNAALARYRTQNNHDRRRQHLGGLTPAQRYALGPRDSPDGLSSPPTSIETKKVTATGTILFAKTAVGIGRRHAGHVVTAIRQGQRIAIIKEDELIAEFVLTRGKRYQSANPRGKNVSAKS